MATLTKPVGEEFRQEEIDAMLAEEKLDSAENADMSLTVNGDGTHTYGVVAKK
jgi:hypothetical protein